MELLYIDSLRGDDATGVCLISKDNDIIIHKEASESADFLRTRELNKLAKTAFNEGRALLGHNRKKTVGLNRDQDAHPFVIDDNTVFFHNGTLHGHKHLADTDVDSNALGIHLNKWDGDITMLEELLSKVSGAYACVWYDQGRETVYMLRNKERPLYLATLKKGGFVYASEPWMLYGTVARNGEDIKEVKLIDVDKLYSFDLSENVLMCDEETLVVKKAPASPTLVTGGTGKRASTKTSNRQPVELSKNESKRLAKQLTGSYQSFWIDDIYPCSTGGHTAFGSYDEYPRVVFKAHFAGKTDDWMEAEIKNQLVHGRVSHTFYDKETQFLVAWLEDVKTTPRSVKKDVYEKATTALH